MRLETAVLDLYISAPEATTSGMARVYTAEAGEASVVIEARDSLTGAVLGRAVDKRAAGNMPGLRTSVSNQEDFKDLFKSWAKASAQGLGELKAM